MDQLTAIVQAINSYLWGVTGLIPLLVGVGIFYTFKLKFVQIRKFGQAMRFTFRGLSLHGERAVVAAKIAKFAHAHLHDLRQSFQLLLVPAVTEHVRTEIGILESEKHP